MLGMQVTVAVAEHFGAGSGDSAPPAQNNRPSFADDLKQLLAWCASAHPPGEKEHTNVYIHALFPIFSPSSARLLKKNLITDLGQNAITVTSLPLGASLPRVTPDARRS